MAATTTTKQWDPSWATYAGWTVPASGVDEAVNAKRLLEAREGQLPSLAKSSILPPLHRP